MKTKSIMIRGVPAEVVQSFRMICLKKGISMTQEVIRLITMAVKKSRKKGV